MFTFKMYLAFTGFYCLTKRGFNLSHKAQPLIGISSCTPEMNMKLLSAPLCVCVQVCISVQLSANGSITLLRNVSRDLTFAHFS